MSLRQALKALDDLEEELRHAGLPPGLGTLIVYAAKLPQETSYGTPFHILGSL